MSKVIYLYNQDNLSSNDKLYKIISDFFQSINPNLLIQFFNYFFNDSLTTNDSISVNIKNLNSDKNSYIPLDSSLPSIDIKINDKYFYSIELLMNVNKNFSMYILKYNLNKSLENSYTINLPEAKILECETKYASQDKFNYAIKIYNHSLSYDISVYKLSNYGYDYLKDNKLFILFPFYMFSIFNKVLSISKMGPFPTELKNEIIHLSEDIYKCLKNLNLCDTYLTRNDYLIIKDTTSEIVDYYLDLLTN